MRGFSDSDSTNCYNPLPPERLSTRTILVPVSQAIRNTGYVVYTTNKIAPQERHRRKRYKRRRKEDKEKVSTYRSMILKHIPKGTNKSVLIIILEAFLILGLSPPLSTGMSVPGPCRVSHCAFCIVTTVLLLRKFRATKARRPPICLKLVEPSR